MTSAAQPKAVADTETGLILACAYIAASPDRIFRALTDAYEIELWWGSADTYRMKNWMADLHEGGGYTVSVVNANGDVRPASGRFLEIKSPLRLVHTRTYDWDYPVLGRRETLITYILSALDEGSRLTVRHEGFRSCEQAALDHAAGWERVLGWLSDYVT